MWAVSEVAKELQERRDGSSRVSHGGGTGGGGGGGGGAPAARSLRRSARRLRRFPSTGGGTAWSPSQNDRVFAAKKREFCAIFSACAHALDQIPRNEKTQDQRDADKQLTMLSDQYQTAIKSGRQWPAVIGGLKRLAHGLSVDWERAIAQSVGRRRMSKAEAIQYREMQIAKANTKLINGIPAGIAQKITNRFQESPSEQLAHMQLRALQIYHSADMGGHASIIGGFYMQVIKAQTVEQASSALEALCRYFEVTSGLVLPEAREPTAEEQAMVRSLSGHTSSAAAGGGRHSVCQRAGSAAAAAATATDNAVVAATPNGCIDKDVGYGR